MRAIIQIFLALVFLMPHVEGGELSEGEMRTIFGDTCHQLDGFYKAESFPSIAPEPTFCRFRIDFDADYKERIGHFISTDQSDVDADILQESGKFIRFHNGSVFHAAYGKNAPLFVAPPPAKWTKDHAIEVAQKFANIFAKSWNVNLAKPNAYFKWPFTGVDQAGNILTKRGEWLVRWDRATPSGQTYMFDSLLVSLSEEYGPFDVTIYFMSQYNEKPIKPIAREKAVEKSATGLDTMLRSKLIGGWLPGAKVMGEPKSELLIVQPNDPAAQKSFEDLAVAGKIKARLAWVVTYHLVNPKSPAINADVSVYIDAETGAFLGGTL